MTESEIYTCKCFKCGKEIHCSEGHVHYVVTMKGAKILCHNCEREFETFSAQFFTQRVTEIILSEIYKNNKNNVVVHRSILFETLTSKGITKKEIDRCLTQFSDCCITNEEWENTDNGWVHAIYVTSEYVSYCKKLESKNET
jgi:hypothetical protein